MRELMFRAFGDNGSKKQMLHFDIFMSQLDDTMKYRIRVGDFPVMQFTGLKDKNGKEIWEGDKIRRTANMRDYAECDGVDIQDYEVEYCGYYFHPFLECGTRMEEYEVIGNIYENADLLTAK